MRFQDATLRQRLEQAAAAVCEAKESHSLENARDFAAEAERLIDAVLAELPAETEGA